MDSEGVGSAGNTTGHVSSVQIDQIPNSPTSDMAKTTIVDELEVPSARPNIEAASAKLVAVTPAEMTAENVVIPHQNELEPVLQSTNLTETLVAPRQEEVSLHGAVIHEPVLPLETVSAPTATLATTTFAEREQPSLGPQAAAGHEAEHVVNNDEYIEPVATLAQEEVLIVDHETQGASENMPEPGGSGLPHAEQSTDGEESEASSTVQLVVDTSDGEDDADSALGDISRASSTRSVTSSVYRFVEEGGRTFHKYKEGKYGLPNDPEEQSRLNLQHDIFCLSVGERLFLAPIQNPQRALDVGTGTGVWAIEFADQFPACDVLGTDLSPIQPSYVPPNCRFEVNDAEDDWIFSEKFDFIHGRHISPFLHDWPKILRNVYNGLAPGGWAEFQEQIWEVQSPDGSHEGSPFQKFIDGMTDAMKLTRRDAKIARQFKHYMEEIGFLNVKEKKVHIPFGPWAKGRVEKLLGQMMHLNTLEGLPAAKSMFVKLLGWSPEEYEVFIVDVRKNVEDSNNHSYMVIHTIYGQKPQ